MHTYIVTRSNGHTLYVVGHYLSGTWQPLADYSREQDAEAKVSYLNGGEHPAKPFPAEVV